MYKAADHEIVYITRMGDLERWKKEPGYKEAADRLDKIMGDEEARNRFLRSIEDRLANGKPHDIIPQ